MRRMYMQDDSALKPGRVDGVDHSLHCAMFRPKKFAVQRPPCDCGALSPPMEKPKMKLEDAIVLARWGNQRKNGVETRARVKLSNEALQMCKGRAEELMLEADTKAEAEAEAEAERVLVDIQVYDSLPYIHSKLWVKRTFNDGSETKALEDRDFARQLKYTFDQGKKAAHIEAKTPRSDDCV